MSNPGRALAGLSCLALLLASCDLGDSPTAAGEGARAQLPLQPALIPSVADPSALPVNRIQARAIREADGMVLADERFDVAPTEFSWTDRAGDLWLLGGVGYDGSGVSGLLNDVWQYRP